MNKLIKTTDTEMKVNTSTILVVEIGMLSFEVDERYPWIYVYSLGDENKDLVTQIDGEDMPTLVEIEDLKRFALNWYFNNVEVVSDVTKS